MFISKILLTTELSIFHVDKNLDVISVKGKLAWNVSIDGFRFSQTDLGHGVISKR